MPADPPPFVLPRIDLGINIRDEHSQVLTGQAPYNYRTGKPGAVNMVSDGKGGVKKRQGTAKVYATSLGAGAVHGAWDYIKYDGTTVRLLHHGTVMYTQSGTSQPVSLHTGIANTKGFSFTMNDKWYYFDGAKIWQYDGTTFAEVTAKIPTTRKAKAPDGTGGTVEESLNLLTNSWTEEFAGTVGDTVYVLDMPADSVTITVDGVPVLPAAYTFPSAGDYTKITFGVAPGVSVPAITGTKAGLNDATEIKACTYGIEYGGSNDSRIFIGGNPANPAIEYWCDNYDPTYWPVNNYNFIGSDADFNSGSAKQFDQLVVLKNRSVYRIDYYEDTANSIAEYRSYPLNAGVGCDCPDSIQIIDNYIVFLNSEKGPQIVERTDVRTEKNVKSIGDLINTGPGRPGLLDETKADLQAATSFDDGRHYILCVGSKVWAWNYRDTPWQGDPDLLQWWYWESINANCWIQKEGVTYFGDRTNGYLWKFIENKNDDGAVTSGKLLIKLLHFDYPEYLKTISRVYFRTNVTNAGKITVTAYSDLTPTGTLFTETITSNSFSWASFSWSMFSWAVNVFDPVIPLKTKIKKVKYLQLEFSNDELNQDLSVLDLIIFWNLNRKVK